MPQRFMALLCGTFILSTGSMFAVTAAAVASLLRRYHTADTEPYLQIPRQQKKKKKSTHFYMVTFTEIPYEL